LHDAHRTEECDGLGDFVLISGPAIRVSEWLRTFDR
jgi:hypothetical protein